MKWVFQAFLAQLDLLVTLEPTALLARRVLLACLVLQGPQGSLDPVVSLALSVLLVRVVPEDLLVNPAQLAPKEKAETRVSLALLDPKVLLAPVVKKGREAKMVSLDPLAPLDRLD